jgi:hypothetical protein
VAVVAALALSVPLPAEAGAAPPCSSTDGPQFRCWLLPETR